MNVAIRQLRRLVREAYSATPRVVDASMYNHHGVSRHSARAYHAAAWFVEQLENATKADVDSWETMRGGVMIFLNSLPPERVLEKFMSSQSRVNDWELVIDASTEATADVGGPALFVKLGPPVGHSYNQDLY